MTDRARDGFIGGAPGASAPGEPGYDGEATIGDEGARAGPESFVDPDATSQEADAAIPPQVREAWARADAKTAESPSPDDPG
ncbi:MAG: hypothetical protein M3144_06960 [Actinomycetota bacterium]|nr:hypothetical protein [Actinomycetota bacterium]